MADGSFLGKARICSVLALAALGCVTFSASVRAQDPAPIDAVESTQGAFDEPEPGEAPQWLNQSRQVPTMLGGATEYHYTSPLEKFGSDLFFGSYVLGAVVSLVYLAVVYPLQALFGSSKVEPVMLWMLLPIAGPWFAQYEDSVKSKPFWRVVLVGDAVLQASGVVLGLIGLALSGKRTIKPQASTRVELNLGVAGAGLTGLTLCVHTL
jgi:hypothetical protein